MFNKSTNKTTQRMNGDEHIRRKGNFAEFIFKLGTEQWQIDS